MHRFIAIFLLAILSGMKLFGQETALEIYIEEGLKSNLALEQKLLSYDKQIKALEESKGLFFPQLTLNARYSIARGGRVIDFPVGDMMNPVYNNLNRINEDLYGPIPSYMKYPNLENEEIAFLRPTEQETKLQLIQPLFSPQIYYGYKINQAKVSALRADVNAYRRKLVLEIGKAYYDYLKSVSYIKMLENSKILADEFIRVNEKLLENDKITIDGVYRAKAESSRLEKLYAEAEKMNELSTAWLNFLVNRSPETEILIDSSSYSLVNISYSTDTSMVNEREELQMLASYDEALGFYSKMQRDLRLPNVYSAFDYGFQGEKYSFTSDDDFVMASFILRWELFKGLRNKKQAEMAQIDKLILESQIEETRSMIDLQILGANAGLKAAIKSHEAALSQNRSAEKSFELIKRQYIEGMANLLQYLDASNTKMASEEELIIAVYDVYQKIAELEYVRAQYVLPEIK